MLIYQAHGSCERGLGLWGHRSPNRVSPGSIPPATRVGLIWNGGRERRKGGENVVVQVGEVDSAEILSDGCSRSSGRLHGDIAEELPSVSIGWRRFGFGLGEQMAWSRSAVQRGLHA